MAAPRIQDLNAYSMVEAQIQQSQNKYKQKVKLSA